MHVAIGHSLDGQPVQVQLAPGVVVLLIGDPRTGRTTLARRLARCWLANLTHRLYLEVDRPHEYDDLARLAGSRGQSRARGSTTTDATSLDELTLRDRRQPIFGQTDGGGPTIITTEPALALLLVESLGRRPSCLVGICPVSHTAADHPTQERLDLPPETRPIRLAAFGVADQPPHRWQMSGLALVGPAS